MSVKTKQQLRDYANANVNTNGVNAITGAVMNTMNIDEIDSFAMEADVTGGNKWKGNWVQQDYETFEQVNDNGWLMIANKPTSERPAPQYSGDPFYLFPAILDAANNPTAKQVIYGQRYTFGIGGYLTGYRVDTVVGNHYRVYSVKDPTGSPVFGLLSSFTANATGWNEIHITPMIILSGTSFEILVAVFEPDPAPTTFQGNWNYLTPKNVTAPTTGVINQSDDSRDLLKIYKTDSDAVDRSAELATLELGDIISALGQQWAIQAIADQGTYINFAVAPSTQASPDGVALFTFEVTLPVPITYNFNSDYWISDPEVQGFLGVDTDYSGVVYDNTQYGIDILLQEATISADWDLQAYSSGGSSGSGGAKQTTGKAALRLLAATGQTFTTATWDLLHFDTITLQRDGVTATATGAAHSITVSESGWYEIFFGISCEFPAADVLELVMYINDVEYSAHYTDAVGAGPGDPIVMAWKSSIPLTAGDKLDLRGRNSPAHGSGSLALTYYRLYLDCKQDF